MLNTVNEDDNHYGMKVESQKTRMNLFRIKNHNSCRADIKQDEVSANVFSLDTRIR